MYVQAIASARVVPHLDGAGIMFVAVEQGAAASVALKPHRRELREVTIVILGP